MLAQRRRRWADVVQMLYKCFVFAGVILMRYKLIFTANVSSVGLHCKIIILGGLLSSNHDIILQYYYYRQC